MAQSALLAGATGLVGGHLLQCLLSDPTYTSIHLILRRPYPDSLPDHVTTHIHDFTDLGSFDVHVNHVFCTLGTTIKKARSKEAFRVVDYDYVVGLGNWAAQCGASFSVVSSIGASPRAASFYLKTKGEMEQTLQSLSLPRLHIFRPALMHAGRVEARPGERWMGVFLDLLAPLMLGPLTRYRPIDAKDVAQAMVSRMQEADLGLQIFESEQISKIGRVNNS